MSALLKHDSFALFALLSAVWLGGCIPRFEQPTLGEPHAVAKIRIVYHSRPNGSLSERVLLNEHNIEFAPADEPVSVEVAHTLALRIRPKPASWSIRSTFSHQNENLEDKWKRTNEEYPCGVQVPCRSHRSESYEDTLKDTVVDATCDAFLEHQVRAGAKYLLQYDFYEHDRCTLQCYEQTPRESGGFDLSPCL